MSDQFEVICEVGVEGGSISLCGIPSETGWKFTCVHNESALMDVDESLGSLLNHQTPMVDTWEEALELLDRYPWHQLYPMNVHADFGTRIWKELLKRRNGMGSTRHLQRWMEVCFPEGNGIARLSVFLKQSRSTVILTGAGTSTESGIPDFRSKDGWWRKMDPRAVATVEALENDYPLFREFYQKRIMDLASRTPHQGHVILARWEERGWIDCIATQNVDGFHQQAGSQRVYELHGSIRTVRCATAKP